MLNGLFINCTNKSTFESLLSSGLIANDQIAFIKSSNEIWTQGHYYDCNDTKYTQEQLNEIIATYLNTHDVIDVSTWALKDNNEVIPDSKLAGKSIVTGSYNSTTGKFVSGGTEVIGVAGNLYVDAANNKLYRYSSDTSTFTLIGGEEINLDNYIQKSQTTGLIKNDGSIDTNDYLTSSDVYTKTEINNKIGDVGNNSVKDYVDNKISDLVNGADENLDTLKEIADVLNNSETGLGAINEALNGKADASDIPTKTGDLTNTGEGNYIDNDESKGYDKFVLLSELNAALARINQLETEVNNIWIEISGDNQNNYYIGTIRPKTSNYQTLLASADGKLTLGSTLNIDEAGTYYLICPSSKRVVATTTSIEGTVNWGTLGATVNGYDLYNEGVQIGENVVLNITIENKA